MKMLIAGVLLTASAGTAWTVNNWPTSQGYLNVVLLDVTDSLPIRPDSARLMMEFGWHGGDLHLPRELRVREIIEVPQGTVSTMQLQGCNIINQPSTWNGNTNEFIRSQQARAFEEDCENLFTSVYSKKIGRSQTALLEPLVEDLLYVQDHRGYICTVHIYSDAGQHEKGAIDFLEKQTLDSLAHQHRQIWASIRGSQDLIDLHGVRIFIVHHPRVAEIARFKAYVNFLRANLEPLGAEVVVTGDVERASY